MIVEWVKKINAGHILTIITMVSGFIVSYTAIVAKASGIMRDQQSLTLTVAQLAEKVAAMDKNGTAFNREKNAAEAALGPVNSRRLDTVEVTLQTLSPSVARIETDIAWMKSSMKAAFERSNGSPFAIPAPSPK